LVVPQLIGIVAYIILPDIHHFMGSDDFYGLKNGDDRKIIKRSIERLNSTVSQNCSRSI